MPFKFYKATLFRDWLKVVNNTPDVETPLVQKEAHHTKKCPHSFRNSLSNLLICLIGLKTKQVHISCNMHITLLIGFPGVTKHYKKQKEKISLFSSALGMLPVTGVM